MLITGIQNQYKSLRGIFCTILPIYHDKSPLWLLFKQIIKNFYFRRFPRSATMSKPARLETLTSPTILPAVCVRPVSSVVLLAGDLLPKINSPLHPVRIRQYQFRIIDIGIGTVERRTFAYNLAGVRSASWAEVRRFSGQDVTAHNIRFTANVLQPGDPHATLKDRITFQVWHKINKSIVHLLVLPVNFSRTELKLVRNMPLTVFHSPKSPPIGSCVTRWNLEVVSNPEEPTSGILYTVTKMPKHGHIYLLNSGDADKIYLGVGSVFRQADVNSGKLFYKFRRVIDDWLTPKTSVYQGIAYVNDEFKFRNHIYSYRPTQEQVYFIDILEMGPDAVPPFSISQPLDLSKQVGFVRNCGSLAITPQLFDIKKSYCAKSQLLPNNHVLKAPLAMEVILTVVRGPRHGKVHVVAPDASCALDAKMLPVSLLESRMLIYTNDGSPDLNDEFKVHISCQDTRGLFLGAANEILSSRLLTLNQMVRPTASIGEAFFEKFRIRVKPDGFLLPDLNIRNEGDKLEVSASRDQFIYPRRLYFSCPDQHSSSGCTGALFRSHHGGALTSSILVVSPLPSKRNLQIVPNIHDRSCVECTVSDGTYSFYKRLEVQQPTLVTVETDVKISVTINGSAYIFFEVSYHLKLQLLFNLVNVNATLRD